MNAAGTGQNNLTNDAGDDVDPVFSPDGTKIAFTSGRDGNDEIYVMNADGTGQTNLTNDAGVDLNPVFSPDGTKIAFESFRDGNWEIYVLNADGTGQTNLTNADGADVDPARTEALARSTIVFVYWASPSSSKCANAPARRSAP